MEAVAARLGATEVSTGIAGAAVVGTTRHDVATRRYECFAAIGVDAVDLILPGVLFTTGAPRHCDATEYFAGTEHFEGDCCGAATDDTLGRVIGGGGLWVVTRRAWQTRGRSGDCGLVADCASCSCFDDDLIEYGHGGTNRDIANRGNNSRITNTIAGCYTPLRGAGTTGDDGGFAVWCVVDDHRCDNPRTRVAGNDLILQGVARVNNSVAIDISSNGLGFGGIEIGESAYGLDGWVR